ncbi:hypothetical protein SFC65_19915 [Priestia filamentosa]|uniref:DUF7694 domain-containing protein n=1 Tax=Priestia filamentosa TaxID=1402861 RepID=UPI003982973A
MKNLNYLNEYRKPLPMVGDLGDEHNGFFEMRIKGEKYRIMASNGFGWEHVSISHQQKHKIPSWKTMNELKELFFEDDEVVMQLHPKKEDYINNHPGTLHLWRPVDQEIPTPPSQMVGLKSKNSPR